MRNLFSILFFAFALAFVACEKDTEVVTTTTTGTIAGNLAPARIDVFGVLTDETGQPVADAVVRAGSKSTQTNEDGLWRIDDANVSATFGYVTFQSTNHLQGSRTVYAEDGASYELNVELLSRAQSYAVSASQGGIVTIGGTEAAVEFAANSFVSSTGAPVSAGEVTVIAHFLDAAEEATFRQMPGDLRGQPEGTAGAENLTLLTSFGMVAVELEDASGAPVELADGMPATLRMPIAADALATAPASIPLWFFDDELGVWVEEGAAIKEGNFYVGQVSHFTFWNCDIPTDFVRLCATIEFDTGGATRPDSNTTTNILVSITSQQWGTTYGYTDANGRLCGIIPANETLELNIMGPCNLPVYTQTIGPFSEDTDLGTIIVTPDQPILISLTGAAACNGNVVTNGVARIYQGGSQIAVIALEPDGTFDLTRVSCNQDDLSVEVADYASRSQSDRVTVPFAAAIDFGTLEACSQPLTNFFEMTVDGVTYFGDSISISSSVDGFYVNGSGFDNSGFFGFDFSSFDPALTGNTLPAPGAYLLSGTQNNNLSVYLTSQTSPNGQFSMRIDMGGQTLNLTQVASAPGEITAGNIGPFQHSQPDSSGSTINYTIELDFAGPHFF